MKVTCRSIESEVRNGKNRVVLVCWMDVSQDEVRALRTFCDLSTREIIDVLTLPDGYLRSMLPPAPAYPGGSVCVTCKDTALSLVADEIVVSKGSHKIRIFIETEANLDWLVGKEIDVQPINTGGK
jgi:hypothetical protein